MPEYVLSCESAIDLSPAMVEEYDLKIKSFHYDLGNDHNTDDLFTSISYSEFYARMVRGDMTTTYALNPNEYTEYFEPFLREGLDVLHVTLSSGLSSTFQNAELAAQELREKYPDRKLLVVDGRGACGGYGLLMAALSLKKKDGMEIEALRDCAEDLKFHVNHLFFSTDLTFYIRGGRISKTAGVFAAALNICPLCDMDELGHLVVRQKIRTKKKVKTVTADLMVALADKGKDYDGLCFINHSDCKEDCEDVVALVEERFPNLKGKIRMNPIGPTIGSHTGPGTVALFFIGASRKKA